MTQQSSFAKDFARANQISTDIIRDVCQQAFGRVRDVRRSTPDQDRSGYDFAIRLGCGAKTTIDVKYRSVDPIVQFGLDDLAIETIANSTSGKPGWALDSEKNVDWLVWLWPTNRWHIAPYAPLRQAAIANVDAWRLRYRECSQTTTGIYGQVYTSKCIFVPKREVWRAIYYIQSGTLSGKK